MQLIQLIVLKQSALSMLAKQADITIFDAPNLGISSIATNLVMSTEKVKSHLICSISFRTLLVLQISKSPLKNLSL